MDYMTMLQRQVEVAGALRSPPTTPTELLKIHAIMRDLSVFLSQITRHAAKLQVPLEHVFQCLMQLGLGHSAGVHFDKQHRQGNVPMHQAKVLDRNAALNAQNIEPKLREIVDEELLETHVGHCKELRTLLRMKVEDGNDLRMAQKLVTLSEEYLSHIHRLAGGDGSRMMKLYEADSETDIDACLSGGGEGGSGAAELGATTSSSAAAGSPVVDPKPLPSNLVKGVTEECRGVLDSLKPEFARRFEALHHILQWVQEVDDGVLDSQFNPLLLALQEPMRVQLADKRSAICRLACDVVGFLCLRSKPGVLCGGPKAVEVLTSWNEVLLKGVHVTVAAIAEATDATIRDLILSTQGATFLLHHIANALTRAQQSELRRKCLNYLVLGLVASSCASRANADFSFLSPLAMKGLSMSEESCRRLARLLLILLEDLRGIKMSSTVDAKQLKLILQERASATTYIQPENLYLFETEVLRYNEPSKASTYFVEKLRGDHAESLSPKKKSSYDKDISPTQDRKGSSIRVQPPPTRAPYEDDSQYTVGPQTSSPKKKQLSSERMHPVPSHMMIENTYDTLVDSPPSPYAPVAPAPQKATSSSSGAKSLTPLYGRRSIANSSSSSSTPTLQQSSFDGSYRKSTSPPSPSLMVGPSSSHNNSLQGSRNPGQGRSAGGSEKQESLLFSSSTTSSSRPGRTSTPESLSTTANNDSLGGLPALPLSLRNLSLGSSASGQPREASASSQSQLSGSLMRRLSSRGNA